MPPIAGPAAAPRPPAAAHTAAAVRSDPTSAVSSSSAAHTAAAPPTAWTPRAASSHPKLGASAQPSEAAATTARPSEQTAPGARRRALIRHWDAEQRLVGTGATCVLGDVTRPETLPPALEGVSRVFHLAGVVGHRASDEERLQRVNVEGSRNLLDAAAAAGVERIV